MGFSLVCQHFILNNIDHGYLIYTNEREDPVTWGTLDLHRHIIPFWNQDDQRRENLPYVFGPKAQLVLWFWAMGPISPTQELA